MRGFVDAIGETFSMSETPARVVIVAGRNYGKLLQISKLWYVSNPTQFFGQALFEAWNKAYNKITSRAEDGSPGEPDQVGLKKAIATDGKLPVTGPVFTPQRAMRTIYEGFYQPQEQVVLDSYTVTPLQLPRLAYLEEIEED